MEPGSCPETGEANSIEHGIDVDAAPALRFAPLVIEAPALS